MELGAYVKNETRLRQGGKDDFKRTKGVLLPEVGKTGITNRVALVKADKMISVFSAMRIAPLIFRSILFFPIAYYELSDHSYRVNSYSHLRRIRKNGFICVLHCGILP